MSIGERIKRARIMAGQSQRELAQAAQVSAMAISKYERDLTVPGSDVLIRISQALHVKFEYFFRPTAVSLSTPAFRKKQSLPIKGEHSILEHVQEWLERYLDIESLLNQPVRCPELTKRPIKSLEDIEDATDELRQQWRLGLDPIEGLTGICEDQGIKVEFIDGHPDFDALTLYANDTIPVIVLRRGMSGDYQRFCLAHELGHIFLEPAHHLNPEKAANRFAGALLAPRSAVTFELGTKRLTISLYELSVLKHKYGLSMQGWIYRAKDLEILPESLASAIFKQFCEKGWHLEEPGRALPAEVPQRFERLVAHALCEGIISKARAADLLGVPLATFIREDGVGYGGLPIEVCG